MKIIDYIKDSFNELKVVSWPSKEETIRLSKIVIILSIIVGILISLIDYILNLGLSFII
jgi:preprotein translocase subunit SecE